MADDLEAALAHVQDLVDFGTMSPESRRHLATLAAAVRDLTAQVQNWERKELVRGSCCTDNEQRAERAEAALAASRKQLEAERIENAHLREAFVTMEKAYNAAVAT